MLKMKYSHPVAYVHFHGNPMASHHILPDILNYINLICPDTESHIFYDPHRLVGTSKRDTTYWPKCPKLSWSVGYCSLLLFGYAALESEDWQQGTPVRATESAADVSAMFSQTGKEKRWSSDNRQLSIRRQSSHSAGQ